MHKFAHTALSLRRPLTYMYELSFYFVGLILPHFIDNKTVVFCKITFKNCARTGRLSVEPIFILHKMAIGWMYVLADVVKLLWLYAETGFVLLFLMAVRCPTDVKWLVESDNDLVSK